MRLGGQDQQLIEGVIGVIVKRYGARLSAVALCGDSAGPTYQPGKTRLELAVVIDAIDADILAGLSQVRGFRARRRIAPLLLFDHAYIQSSLDVFPLEFLDLSDRHVLLRGDVDPFVGLSFEREHMRLQVEQQLRGKLLHLWEAYLRARGSRSTVRRMLIQTPTAFEVIARGILYLLDTDRPVEPFALIAGVERAFDVPLPTLALLERVRAGTDSLSRKDVEETFSNYLAEIRLLVEGADKL